MRAFQSPSYAGSIIACGHSLTVHDGDGNPITTRGGTRVDGIRLGALYDARDGTIAEQRRLQHRIRKEQAIRRRLAK